MSNATETVERPASTCPNGCIASHGEDDYLHLFAEKVIRDQYGNLVSVSMWVNDKDGTAGVYAGEHELLSEDAETFANAVKDAAYQAELARLSRR